MKTLKICLFALLLLIMTQSNLQVYMPTCAVQQIKTAINYTLANFGHIPYGKIVIGELVIPKTEETFCNSDSEESFFSLQSESIKKFVLIKRGDCKFTKKILNAQKKGAEMVIIYDHQETSIPGIVMSNDGHGHLIDIPSVFISKSDGKKLIDTFQKCGKSVILKIYYDVFTSKVADVTFWLDINNRESFITLRDFSRDYHTAIAKHVNYDVKY